MLVDVQSIRGGRTVTLAIHNSGWKRINSRQYQRRTGASKPEVPSSLSSVLRSHKVGDVVAVRVQEVGNVLTLHSAKSYRAREGEFAADSAFFVKAETKQRSLGQSITYVTLLKYGKTRVVPLMQLRTTDDKGRVSYVTRPDLADAVGALTRGDLVEIDVGTERGKKAIRHIAEWQEPQVGTFVALGQAEVDKVKHVTVQIYTSGGQTVTAMIQQKSYDGVKYVDDYAMARYARRLTPDQKVAYKTRMHGDKAIIWLIGPAREKPSAR